MSSIASTSAPAVLLLDAEGIVLMANPAAATVFGQALEALAGQSIVALLHFELLTDDPVMRAIQWEALCATASVRPQSIRARNLPRLYHLRLDVATKVPVQWFATLLPTMEDVVEPAPVHPLLDALTLLANRSVLGFFDLRLDIGEITTSAGWKRMLGYTDHELPDTLASWRCFVHPDDTAAAPDQVTKRQSPGVRSFADEYRLRHRAGHYLWVSCVGIRVFNSDGVLQRVCGLHLDVSERKELEEISLLSDERFQRLVNQGGLGAFDLDFTQGQHWFSPAWHRLLGTKVDDAAFLPEPAPLLAALPAPAQAAGLSAFFKPTQAGNQEGRQLVALTGAKGESVNVLIGFQSDISKRGELLRVTGFVLPLAGLAAAPGSTPPALQQAAFDSLAECIIITDARAKVLSLNAKAATLTGVTVRESTGQPLASVFNLLERRTGQAAPDAIELALNQPAASRLCDLHALPTSEHGVVRPIVWKLHECHNSEGVRIGFVVVFRDPEEMRLSPDELIQANRSESLGLLAGGIAHDFNNLLTTILGGVSTAKENRDFNQLDAAEQACLAAKQLTRQLLSFAKGGGNATRQVVNLSDVLQNAVRIAASGSPVVVKVEAEEDVTPVEVDKGQMLQVIQNLVINSIQSMPVPSDGRIVVRAENIELNENEFLELPRGLYARIDVEDNGAGIPADVLPHIFDPFFTTKKTGTGLGLATVDSIVRRHGGRIGVESSPSKGTLFSIFLPAAVKPVQAESRRAPALRFGTGRILLMDDDPKIAELTGVMIASLDYTHDTARNGEEALQLYRRYHNVQRPYDAVLLDLTVIGGMGGEECFKRLRAIDPDVRAIVTSGYDDDEMINRFLEMGFCGYLTKPYRVGDLGRMLKTVLGR